MLIGGIVGFLDGYKESVWIGLFYAGAMMFVSTLFMIMISAITFIGNGFDHK
jgi:hypothetical protein